MRTDRGVVRVASGDNPFACPIRYTRALLSAVPVPDPEKKRKRIVVECDVPSPMNPPSGCTFHPRCPIAQKGLCDVKVPELRTLGPTHRVACQLAE